mmetsp:Transcript_14681/g.38931  ORF Transcript_14681/g.38931 Transcript_14681/m.38931 type:complete len:228 (-) Transcript_14681:392-1075(-)
MPEASLSSFMSTVRMAPRMVTARIPAFSASAEDITTSAMMPTRRFSIMKEEMTMKSMNNKSIILFPVVRIASQATVTSSRIEPRKNSVNMHFPMEPKWIWIGSSTSSSARGPWWNSLVNMMENVKQIRNSRTPTHDTALNAANMPLMSIIISGKARMSLIRRVTRMRRTSRRLLSLAIALPSPASGRIHVSLTIMATRMLSKTNHPLLQQELFLRYAKKRMAISDTK